MVLGMILYESVDLAYNVVKLGYNGVRGTYYWWYGMDYPGSSAKRFNKSVVDVGR